MKRFLIAAFAGVLIVSGMTGCGKKQENNENTLGIEESTQQGQSGENPEAGGNEAEMVEIYFPASAFNEASEESIKSDAASMGAEAIINDDGSVVYKMSKENQDKQLKEIKEVFTENCNALANNDNYPFIKEITLDERLEEVTIKVDRAGYEAQSEEFRSNVFANSCFGYQTLNGVKTDDLKAVLHFIDVSNNSEYKTETYNKDGLVE